MPTLFQPKVLIAAVLIFVLAFAGCEVGPDYKSPSMNVASSFQTGTPTTRPALPTSVANLATWWRSFNDPVLDQLIDDALASNLDLRIALSHLQESRASAEVISGGMLPYLEGSGAAGRGSGNNSTKGRISNPLNAAANPTGLTEITQIVGFDAGWELDIFGKYRRQLEAAIADTQATIEARNKVLVTVLSDVARTYIEMRVAQLRIQIAQQNIDVFSKTLDLVQQRFNRGIVNELDVALARRQLASERAAVPPMEFTVAQAQRRLAVLTGRSPEALYADLAAPAQLPTVPVRLVVGLPADLLRNRPDIRQAERELASANARIGVATAELYPRVAVTAGVGLQGQGLGRNPNPMSFIWSVGPTASVPILDFGRIDSMIQVESFRTREAFENYRKTVLMAVEEVDNAAGDFDAQRERIDRLNEALDASRRAVNLANGRYDVGLVDFLNVLDAQRQLYLLEDEATLAQQAELVEYIALYKALGGGWQNYQKIPDIPVALPAMVAMVQQSILKIKSVLPARP